MNKIIIDPQPPEDAINFFYDGDDQLARYVWQYQIPNEVAPGLVFNKRYVWGDCPHGDGYDAEFIDGKWYWVKTNDEAA